MLDTWPLVPASPQMTPQLHGMMVFLEKLCLDPDALGPEDIATVKATGVSAAGIRDASYVCSLFSMIVRIADALSWDIPPNFKSSGVMLVKFGYKLPPFL